MVHIIETHTNQLFTDTETIADITDYIAQDEQIEYDDYDLGILNNKMYIGLPIYENYNEILFGCHISAPTFYRYNTQDVCKFLRDWSCSANVSQRQYPEIMKLIQTHGQFTNGEEYTVYTVVLKTVWLKIIQRKWKRIMRNRMLIKQCNAFTGKNIPMPNIRGCLSNLRK